MRLPIPSAVLIGVGSVAFIRGLTFNTKSSFNSFVINFFWIVSPCLTLPGMVGIIFNLPL